MPTFDVTAFELVLDSEVAVPGSVESRTDGGKAPSRLCAVEGRCVLSVVALWLNSVQN
jgi:hypothetical protein